MFFRVLSKTTRDFVVQLLSEVEPQNLRSEMSTKAPRKPTSAGTWQLWPIPVFCCFPPSRSDARLECGYPELATHFEPRLAGFRANVHGRLNGALGVKTRRERRWRSAR
jgi:hypothetical protein